MLEKQHIFEITSSLGDCVLRRMASLKTSCLKAFPKTTPARYGRQQDRARYKTNITAIPFFHMYSGVSIFALLFFRARPSRLPPFVA